jgi:hypothetical protein
MLLLSVKLRLCLIIKHHTMNMQWSGRVLSPLVASLLVECELSAPHVGRLTLPKIEPSSPFVIRLGGPQSPSERYREENGL